MTVSVESLQTGLHDIANYLHSHLSSLQIEIEKYISEKGGISEALSALGSQLSSMISVITSLSAALNLPNADLSLLTKVYSGIQTLEKVVKSLESVINANSK